MISSMKILILNKLTIYHQSYRKAPTSIILTSPLPSPLYPLFSALEQPYFALVPLLSPLTDRLESLKVL